MDTEPEVSNRIASLIEIYNSDIQSAVRDGLGLDEAIAIVGSIAETMFKAINSQERELCWTIMKKIMDRKFRDGEL